MKKLLSIFTLALLLIMPLSSAYYGGSLDTYNNNQEYTTYHVVKSSPYGSYDKSYVRSTDNTPYGKVTTKQYTINSNDYSYGYPSSTYKTYSTTKTSRNSYSGYNYYPTPSYNNYNTYRPTTYSNYLTYDRSCLSYRCHAPYAQDAYRYSNDYGKQYYYQPIYDRNQGYYNWRY